MIVESCEPSPVIIKDIYEFLTQNILSYYDFELLGVDNLTISIHDPADE